eukprot:4829949-Amphidinium_carterae.1
MHPTTAQAVNGQHTRSFHVSAGSKEKRQIRRLPAAQSHAKWIASHCDMHSWSLSNSLWVSNLPS